MSNRQRVQGPREIQRIEHNNSNQPHQSPHLRTTNPIQPSPDDAAFDSTRQNAVLNLQQTIGNRAVLRRLDASGRQTSAKVQRDTDAASQLDPSPSGKSSQNAAPSQPPRQGDPVTTGNLVPLLERRIDRWKDAADWGIQNFTDKELASLLKSSGAEPFGFATSLIGNIAWAATCFTPGANVIFAISLAGISLGAYGTYAGAPKGDPANALINVKKLLQGYVSTIHQGLGRKLLPSAEAVIKDFPKDGALSALNRIMAASFKPEFLTAIENPPSKSEINEAAVTDAFEEFATDYLKQYQQEISPTLPGDDHDLSVRGAHNREGQPSIIQIKDKNRLALTQLWNGQWYFMRWISPQMHDAALNTAKEEWKAAGGWFDPEVGDVPWSERQPIPYLESEDIKKVPSN